MKIAATPTTALIATTNSNHHAHPLSPTGLLAGITQITTESDVNTTQ